MRLAYSILQLDRPNNSNLIRKKLSFLEEIPAVVCDGYKEYPGCTEEFPEYEHIFNPHLTNQHHSIGLWISVIKTLRKFVNSDYDALLMLEDDVEFASDFERKFGICLEEMPKDWGLFSLGYWDLYLDHFCNITHLHDIEPMTRIVCRLFQSGVSWGWMYRKEFAIELLEYLKVTDGTVHGMHDQAITSLFLTRSMPTQFKAYSVRPSVGSLCFDGKYYPTYRPEDGQGLPKDADPI